METACASLTHPAFDNLNESIPYLCSHCTFTKQYNKICELKETIKVLTSKVAKLETPSSGYQPVAAPLGSAKPNQNLVKNLPRSQPSVPPDRKLNVVVYGLKENPSNSNRQERL